ncbi:hypothetical protein ONA70_03015 [Micromonospora yasonensis]|uniref:hypothetical protein n=1 Tax=Micromonospora yasonensis TaxID=1128667 RepID=UPI002231CC3B|nr:hypothetical protein [Micromonospora yasonensis]MCW3839066.1 hypothetical protein [Micromonospora yasonensis]
MVWAVGAVCVDGALEAWAADEIGVARVGRAFVRAGQLAQVGTVLGAGVFLVPVLWFALAARRSAATVHMAIPDRTRVAQPAP